MLFRSIGRANWFVGQVLKLVFMIVSYLAVIFLGTVLPMRVCDPAASEYILSLAHPVPLGYVPGCNHDVQDIVQSGQHLVCLFLPFSCPSVLT